MTLTDSLSLVIPTMLLRLLAAFIIPPGSYGDADALITRISDVEKRLDEIEGKMIKREDLEALVKELINKYGIRN